MRMWQIQHVYIWKWNKQKLQTSYNGIKTNLRSLYRHIVANFHLTKMMRHSSLGVHLHDINKNQIRCVLTTMYIPCYQHN